MNAPDTDETDGRSTERERWLAGFARLYAPMIVLAYVILQFPAYAPVEIPVTGGSDSVRVETFEPIWGGGTDEGAAAVFLVFVLTAVLVPLIFNPALRVLPSVAAGFGGLLLFMLLVKVGTDHDPPLSSAGRAGVALAVMLIVVGIAHEVTLAVGRSE